MTTLGKEKIADRAIAISFYQALTMQLKDIFTGKYNNIISSFVVLPEL